MCDFCWELDRRIRANPPLAMKIAQDEYRVRLTQALLNCAAKYVELLPDSTTRQLDELIPYEREVTRWLNLGHDRWYQGILGVDRRVIKFWDATDERRPRLFAKVNTATKTVEYE